MKKSYLTELHTDTNSYLPFKLPFYDENKKKPVYGLVLVNKVFNRIPSDEDDIHDMLFDHITEEISILTKRLQEYPYDNTIYYDSVRRKEIRTANIERLIKSQPEVDIVTMARNVYERRQRQLNNETF